MKEVKEVLTDNKDSKKWCILDEDTGEIIKTHSPVKSKEEIQQSKLNKLIKINNQGLICLKGIIDERHSRVYHRRRVPTNNWKYKGYILDLILTLAKHTNEISHISVQGKCRPMTKDDIIEYLNISESTFYAFLKEMKSLGVIAEVTFDINDIKRTSYVVNPAYTNNGVYLNIFTYRAFETDPTFRSILTQYQIEQVHRAELHLMES